jgi:hypothetical protein
MERAALEIARLSDENDGLRAELLIEQERRLEAEAHLETSRAEFDDRLEEKEAEVRDECDSTMQQELQRLMQRWMASWAHEQEMSDQHLDRKIDILARGIDAGAAAAVGGGEDKENAGGLSAGRSDLEDENLRLRREVELLTRQLHARSPTRNKSARHGRAGSPLAELNIGQDMEKMRISSDSSNVGVLGTGSPLKKVRTLAARKWDVLDQDEEF